MSHPYINTHPSNPNPYTSYQPSPVPGPAYAAQHMPQHYMSGMPPGPAHAMPPPGYSFGQPPSRELWPNHGDWDDERDYVDGQEVIYGQLEVSPTSSSRLETPSTSPTPSPFFLPSPFPLLQVQGQEPGSGQNQCQDCVPGKMDSYIPSIPPPSTPSPHVSNHSASSHLQRSESDSFKVKHRRRTTPEQLKVLEHWFDVNPKPDNNLREWLAVELGMTKRNIQVWFQNRQVGLARSCDQS